MRLNAESIFVPATVSIRDAIAAIDRGACGVALVVDADRHLVGTITDGDVRRAMLSNLNLDDPVGVILARKVGSQYPKPTTALVGAGAVVIRDVPPGVTVVGCPARIIQCKEQEGEE